MGVADRVGRAAQETVEDLFGSVGHPAALLEHAARALEEHAQGARQGLARRGSRARHKRELVSVREEEAARFQARAAEARKDGLTAAAEEAEGFLAKARAGVNTLAEEARVAEAEVAELERAMAALEEAARDVRKTRERLLDPLRRIHDVAEPTPPPQAERPTGGGAGNDGGPRGEPPPRARDDSPPDPEVEFERMRRKSDVEERLAALKRKVQGGG